MKLRSKASAPGKLMLLGEHSVVFGHPCLVTAVDLRLSVTVSASMSNEFVLTAPDLGVMEYHRPLAELGQGDIPKAVRFIEVAYALFLQRFPQQQAVVVQSKNEFTSAYGLGSSSASTVAFLAAVADFYEVTLDTFALFDLAYRTVLQIQGMASGFDLAAAIWGGTLLYQKPAKLGEKPTVEVLDLSVNDLPFLVGYTGIKADTATLIAAVAKLREQQPKQVEQWFAHINELVVAAKHALLVGDLETLGTLLTENQQLLRRLRVSSQELETLIQASLQAGALGAKLSGAGGGDCMVALVDQVHRQAVTTAITANSGTIIGVQMHAPGVRLETTA